MAEAPESTETESEESSQLDLFAEKIADQNRKVAERQEQLLEELRASRREAPKVEKPAEDRIYSPAEIQKFIDDGHITAADGMAYLAEVKAAQMVQAAEKRMIEQNRTHQSETAIQAKLQEFREAIPGLSDRTSDDFKEAKSAFQEMLKEGYPDSAATELAALRSIFGKTPGQPRKTEIRETTGERATVDAAGTGSGRKSSKSSGSTSASGFPSWVEPHRVEYYNEGIKRGIYTGPKDPNLLKELEILKAKKGIAA